MDYIGEKELATVSFPCTSCGAYLKYVPGTGHMSCEYCGKENEIPEGGEIEENDFFEALVQNKTGASIAQHFAKCRSCGSSSVQDGVTVSAFCPYCHTPYVSEDGYEENSIQPQSLLPFRLDKASAKDFFLKWIDSLWFAPNDLKKSVKGLDHFNGVYIPYWTYDTNTYSQYTGERGEYYYVTETYTATENGKSVTKTRQVRKTRWYSVQGAVRLFFDDILVGATRTLPEKYVQKLEPWDLDNLVPFDKSYLSGFTAEKYQVDVKEGFEVAKQLAEPQIRQAVRNDIGGDEQRIDSLNMRFRNITYKHLLCPVYVSVYRYNNKVYQFLINARTGEVQGARPYSWIKITLAILLSLMLIAAIIFAAKYYKDTN